MKEFAHIQTNVPKVTTRAKISRTSDKETMWALVYQGPGKKAWIQKPKPTIKDPTDVILKVVKTTICGTDLHILKGDVPEVKPGTTLGHEGIGIIEAKGDAVFNFRIGDKVLISCISADGICEYCKRSMYSHCKNGGWVLGHLIDGTHAEYVRIPFADNSLYHLPENVDEDALTMLSDIIPTGYECGVLNGKIKPGDTVAIVGAGPIGLSTLITCQLFSPTQIIVIDINEYRLKFAKQLGATTVLKSDQTDIVQKILEMTDRKGVDVAIEAVGVPETFEMCQMIVAPGGHIANIGVHGRSAELFLQDLWSKNITITTRLVDTETTTLLLKIVQSGRIQPKSLITHYFKLKEIIEAYDLFENAEKEDVLKIIINNE